MLRTAFFITAALIGSAQAQSPTDIANLTELVVVENQVLNLPPGGLKYKNVTIKENGKILLSGSTTILTGKLITEKGATIEYKAGSQPAADVNLTISAVDASQLKQLNIIGNGKSAQDFSPGARAAGGGNGRDAETSCRGIPPRCRNHGADTGGGGAGGAGGGKGENAVDITLFLPGLKPGATIIAESIGGKGGRGQDGGNGGAGGKPNPVHPAGSGGPGGPAGPGGRGGDAGVVHAFIVLAQADMSKAEEFIKSVTFNANVAPGAGGAPGDPGGGGPGGGESGFCLGKGCSKGSGSPGATAQPGAQGDGPEPGKLSQKWVSIEAMELTAYQAYVAQLWKQLSN